MGFINHVNVWDSGWYRSYVCVLKDGTFFQSINPENGQAVWGFFPAYPLVVKALWQLVGCKPDLYLVGSIFSSVCFMLAEYVGYLYIRMIRDDDKYAQLYIALMSFGPYTFYFSIMYTEAMFLLLLISFLYFMRKEQYILMGMCGAVLSATRSAGVMIAWVLMIHCILEYTREHRKFEVGGFLIENIKKKGMVLGVLMIPIGLFSYMYYLYKGLGDPIAFVHVEAAWDRAFGKTIVHFEQAFLSGGYGRYMFAIALGVAALIIYELVRYKRYEEVAYPVIVTLMSLPTSTQGYPRYMVGSFFIVLFVCDVILDLKKPFRIAAGVMAAAYSLLLFVMWMDVWPVLC